MCGFAGGWFRNLGYINSFKKSSEKYIGRRGLDETGEFSSDNSFWLKHWRLSLVGGSDGSQPVVDKEGRWIFGFNGEIYNCDDIQRRFDVPNSLSDTRIIFDAWLKEGWDVFNYVEGFFSFCIVDLQSNGLFLGRDFFGIKPVYFSVSPELTFASTDHVFRGNGVDRSVVDNYLLNGYAGFGDKSFYKDVQAVGPGTVVWLKRGASPKITFKIEPKAAYASFDSRSSQAFKEKLLEGSNSDSRIASAVMVSGGLDSSALALLLAQKIDSNISTISSVTPYQHSESVGLNMTLKALGRLGCRSDTFVQTSESISAAMIETMEAQGRPLGDLSEVTHFQLVRKLSSHGCKIIYGGLGADELFFGYRYQQLLASRAGQIVFILRVLVKNIFIIINNFYGFNLAKHFIFQNHSHFENILGRRPRYFSTPILEFNPVLFSLKSRIFNHFLRYEDHNVGYFGLEARPLYLKTSFYRFVLNNFFSNPRLFFELGYGKKFLRKNVIQDVPKEVVENKNKLGFPADIEFYMPSVIVDFIPYLKGLVTDGKLDPFFSKSKFEKWISSLASPSSWQGRRGICNFRVFSYVIWINSFDE